MCPAARIGHDVAPPEPPFLTSGSLSVNFHILAGCLCLAAAPRSISPSQGYIFPGPARRPKIGKTLALSLNLAIRGKSGDHSSAVET
jgi:hypothetical protein